MLSADDRRERIDRIVDIISVLLISVTSALSAVCIYQSGRWSGDETRLYNLAADYRISSGIAVAKSNELRLIDISVFLRYIDAVGAHRTGAADFLGARFRPEARPAIEAWLKSDPLHNPKAASSPFVLPEYRLATDAEAARNDALSQSSFSQAKEANADSEAFLRLTVILSTVAFLGGMSTKFRPPLHVVVVAVGCVALTYGVVRMLALPFH